MAAMQPFIYSFITGFRILQIRCGAHVIVCVCGPYLCRGICSVRARALYSNVGCSLDTVTN